MPKWLSERAAIPRSTPPFGRCQAYWHQQITDIMTRGRRDGSFRPDLDPRAAAAVITGAMVATQRPPFQGLTQFDRVAAELLRAFVNPSR